MSFRENITTHSPQIHKGLIPLTKALLDCVTPADVVSAVVERGIFVLGALAGLVALVSEDQKFLEVVRTSGYSDAVMTGWERFSLADNLPLSDAVRDNAVLLFEGQKQWRERYPDMMQQVPAGNFKASASLPLSARGRIFGGLHFSFPTEREFLPADEDFLEDLARQCSLALDRALLLERAELAREQAEAAQERLIFLAQASALLGDSLEYPTRLEALARLCVPVIADWAGVDVLNDDGSLERLAVAHRLPEREAVMREVQRRYPPNEKRDASILSVIRTGEKFLVPEITSEMMERGGLEPEHIQLLQLVGLRAVLSLPLVARGRAMGALTLGMAPEPEGSGRRFTDQAVALAEELAHRAAAALDNARLFNEAKRESAAREEERRRTEAVMESIGEMFYALDSSFRFTYVNHHTEKVWERERTELIGRIAWEVFPQLVDTEAYQRQIQAMQEREIIRFETVSVLLGRWIECTCYPSEDGGISVYFRDIQEQKAAEQALRASEGRYRRLLDTALEGILFLDADGVIDRVNERFAQMLGYGSPEELIHQPVFSLFFPEDEGKARDSWAARQEGMREEYELRLRGRDNAPRWFIAHVSIERSEDGVFLGTFTMFTDITERKYAEIERDRAADERAMLVEQLQEASVRQRRFLQEMLLGFTEGRLRLCYTREELPARLPPLSEPMELSEAALRLLRTQIEAVAEGLNLSKERRQDIKTAAHEAAMNAVRHGGGGTARVYGNRDTGLLQVRITDRGAGIAEELIHRAIEQGFTTGGFGQGFFLMRSCADRVFLLTGRQGTTVVLEQERSTPEPAWLRP